MRKTETQNKSDGERYYVIENGVRLSGMPAFEEHSGTNDSDTWKLVVFIRHLPQLSAEELQKMERLNPKTEGELLSTQNHVAALLRRFLDTECLSSLVEDKLVKKPNRSSILCGDQCDCDLVPWLYGIFVPAGPDQFT